jgi:hypothetical protein
MGKARVGKIIVLNFSWYSNWKLLLYSYVNKIMDDIRSGIHIIYKLSEAIALLDMCVAFTYMCTVADYGKLCSVSRWPGGKKEELTPGVSSTWVFWYSSHKVGSPPHSRTSFMQSICSKRHICFWNYQLPNCHWSQHEWKINLPSYNSYVGDYGSYWFIVRFNILPVDWK